MALPPLELFSLERAALLPGGPFVFVAWVLRLFQEARWGPVFTRGDSLDTIRKGAGCADVAQLVEQLIRNQQVIGSSPIVGSIESRVWPLPHLPLLVFPARTTRNLIVGVFGWKPPALAGEATLQRCRKKSDLYRALTAFSLLVLTEQRLPWRLFLKNSGSPASVLAGVEEKPHFAAPSCAE